MTTFLEILEQKHMIELTAKRLNISFDDLIDTLEANGLKLAVEDNKKWINTLTELSNVPSPFSEERT